MQSIDTEKKKGRSHFRGTAQVYGRNLDSGLTKSPINNGFLPAALPIYASLSKNDSGTCTEKRAESVQAGFPSVLPVPS